MVTFPSIYINIHINARTISDKGTYTHEEESVQSRLTWELEIFRFIQSAGIECRYGAGSD